MLCSMRELLAEAVADNRAVPGFNVANMECTMGVIAAAEETNTPIILQIAEKRMDYSPAELMGPMMVEAARNAKVKVAVLLDHGKTMAMVKKVLGYGFTAIMFDGSDYPLEENIRLTNEVIAVASQYGADVEAELGVLAGNEGDGDKSALYADPEEARRFLEATDVQALAIAIGNAHGHYKGIPKLNFDILDQVNQISGVPLVLHGGSGITEEQFRKAISLGIRKINIATINFDSLVAGAKAYLENTEDPDYFGMNASQVEMVKKAALENIRIFSNK